jgi:hypothetical protein
MVRCSLLRMMPMHAWGQVSVPPKGSIQLAISLLRPAVWAPRYVPRAVVAVTVKTHIAQ